MTEQSIDSHLLDHLPKSAVALFAVFSRFECALKRAGFHYGDGDANPHWDNFANSLGNDFFRQIRDSGRAPLFFNTPPKKQIVQGGTLDWQDAAVPSNSRGLFVLVRRTRNNLFHGGKYPSGPVRDQSRDEELLLQALFILGSALRASSDVSRYYHDGLG